MNFEFEVKITDDSSLKVAVENNKLVYPLAITSTTGTVRGGIAPSSDSPVYYQHLRLENGAIKSVTKFRHGDGTAVPNPDESIEILKEPHIYVGPLHNHFGHFIVESITRLWISVFAKFPKAKFLVLPEIKSVSQRGHYSYADIPNYQSSILQIFGVDEKNTTIITKPAVFETLIIPSQWFLWGGEPHQQIQKQLIKFYQQKIRELGLKNSQKNKIFLVRGDRYLLDGYVAGERYLMHFFKKNGYQLHDPHAININQQIYSASSATHAFGLQSSVFHIFNIIGNDAVNLCILKRLTGTNHSSFSKSFLSIVDNISYIESSKKILVEGASFKNICIFDDIDQLLSAIKNFDDSINLEFFDVNAYFECIKMDVEAFNTAIARAKIKIEEL